MPHYFLFENLPAERPVGPLTGWYESAQAKLPIADDAKSPIAGGRIRTFFRRLVNSEWSLKSEAATIDIGRILREAGVLEITCHYDGGNDEGFAHFESAATKHGTKTLEELIDFLRGSRLGAVDYDPYATLSKLTPDQCRDWQAQNSQMTETQRIGDFLECFIEAIAVALLGEGFGTGEYAMEGRFRLDLRTGSITDLPIEPPPDFRNSGAFSLDHYYPDKEPK
jgi:hypothetical protein